MKVYSWVLIIEVKWMIFLQKPCVITGGYPYGSQRILWYGLPSGYVKIAIENGHWNSWFTHQKWWFVSIVMFVYQRVTNSSRRRDDRYLKRSEDYQDCCWNPLAWLMVSTCFTASLCSLNSSWGFPGFRLNKFCKSKGNSVVLSHRLWMIHEDLPSQNGDCP